jgi:hypothetical protein
VSDLHAPPELKLVAIGTEYHGGDDLFVATRLPLFLDPIRHDYADIAGMMPYATDLLRINITDERRS